MSVVKTPRAFILIPDSEGKITNYEIEFMPKYTGTDADIAKSFNSAPVREEVSAEVFESFVKSATTAGTKAVAELSAALETKRIDADAASTAFAAQLEAAQNALREALAQRDEIARQLDGLLKGIAQQLVPFAKQ